MRGRAEATSAGTEKKNAKDYAAETNSVDTIQRARRRTIGRASATSFAEERRWSGHQKLVQTGKWTNWRGQAIVGRSAPPSILCSAKGQSTITVAVGL